MTEIEIRGMGDLPVHREWNGVATDFTHYVVEFTERMFGRDYSLRKAVMDWRTFRSHSFAAMDDGLIINLTMTQLQHEDGERYQHVEYPSFHSHPIIGSFYSRQKFDGLKATIVHEIAHTVVFYLNLKYGLASKPHHWNWRIIYARLRTEFINPYLQDQSLLAKIRRAWWDEYSRRITRLYLQSLSRQQAQGDAL